MTKLASKATTFIPSPEQGVRLELVVVRPDSSGPYPTLIFNHGSTGGGRSPAMFRRTICPATVASYFADRGWMVLFPQRRGRGKSGGTYAEGLAADGTGYSCDPSTTVRGFERAIVDVDAVLSHVRTRDDVELNHLAIGGMSRGGILAIAYAGMRPNIFCGAINFSGGWLGQGCPTYEKINAPLFKRGATAGIETLWLYGKKDNYYKLDHCRSNFDGFVAAGGKGSFLATNGGHGIIYKPDLWKHVVDAYLERIVLAKQIRSPTPDQVINSSSREKSRADNSSNPNRSW